jgi:hypothetical protein
VASPLLANVYLHYVFDLWAKQWRKREARGNVVFVRYERLHASEMHTAGKNTKRLEEPP